MKNKNNLLLSLKKKYIIVHTYTLIRVAETKANRYRHRVTWCNFNYDQCLVALPPSPSPTTEQWDVTVPVG